MKNSKFLVLTKLDVFILICLVFVSGWLNQAVSAQCTSVDFQESFKKVYRNHKMFLENVADLNNDGKPDAYGYQLQPNNTFQNLVILPNDNNGGFEDPIIVNTTFPVSNNIGIYQTQRYTGITVGDLNNDELQDMVVMSQTTPSAFFSVINNGNFSFTQQGGTTTLPNERIVRIADINNDGRGDLITMVIPSFTPFLVFQNQLYYRLGNPDGTFSAQTQLYDGFLVSPVAGDFNKDNLDDVAFSYYDRDLRQYFIKALINLGGGIFSESTAQEVNMGATQTADIDGDGKLDIISSLGYLKNTGNGNFVKVLFPTTPAPDFSVVASGQTTVLKADVDGDGNTDVIYKDDSQRSFHIIFLNDGAGNFTRINKAKPYFGYAANMDSNAATEQIAFVNSTRGAPLYSPTNETVVFVKNPVCQQVTPTHSKFLDFVGDGFSDVVLWNPGTGNWRYISNVYSGSFNWGLGSLGDIPAPGDFDGDGKTDPTVYRNSTGDWYVSRTSDSNWYVIKFGVTGDIPVPADYNGDGVSEIAVFRPSDGNWYLWDVVTQQFQVIHFGVEGDKPLPQDYDGDGKMDIAVYRPSTGVWYVLKSSDSSFSAIQWGVSTDVPVPADYDSDGKADLAVFRQQDSIWYIYRSFDSNQNYIPFAFIGDEIPMAVDSNGDGVIELALYSPTSKAWYASGQHNLVWRDFGSNSEVPVRMLLPNIY